MEALNDRLRRAIPAMRALDGLQVRIGVHTGRVVIDDVGTQNNPVRLALGVAVNIAARLLDVTEPDCLVISADTHRLMGGGFVVFVLCGG